MNDEVLPYAQAVVEEMTRAGVRAEVQGGASIPKLVGAGSVSTEGDRGRGRAGWQGRGGIGVWANQAAVNG